MLKGIILTDKENIVNSASALMVILHLKKQYLILFSEHFTILVQPFLGPWQTAFFSL